MNPELNDNQRDDDVRRAFRTLLAAAPAAPTFDEMTDIAARNGIRTPEWATDRYALPDAAVAARRPRRRAGGIVMAWLLAVGVIGGGGYAAYGSLIGPDGYDSPTAATRGFLGALEDGNLLKASRALVPWERAGLEDDLRVAVTGAQHDGLLAANDLGAARNISLTERGLELNEVPLAKGTTRVEVTAGTLDLRLEPGLFADSAAAPTDLPKTVDLVQLVTPRADDREVGRPGLVTVQSDGDWYVSLSYTIADHQRVSLGRPLPDLTSALHPTGADSPEAAADRGIALIFGNRGLATVLDMIDPISGQAFLRYVPLFIGPTDAPLMADPVAQWAVDGTGDTRTARLTKLTIPATTDQPEQVLTPDHRCTSVGGACNQVFGGFLFDRGVTVVERDGRWFINPIGATVNLFTELVTGRTLGNLNTAVASSTPSSQSSSAGTQRLAALAGTPGMPPEARNDPAYGWVLSFVSSQAPSSQVLALVGPCLETDHAADSNAQDGPGTVFPDGFFDCVNQELGGSSLADGPGVILPNTVPSPTTTP